MKTFRELVANLPYPKQYIKLIDVGARWGTNPPWDQIDTKYLKYIGFEPDEEECQILTNQPNLPNVEYIPVALLDKIDERTLYITKEPGCSSVFEPDQSAISKYFLSERWDIQKEIKIKTVPLSQILCDKNADPDVLKIDVQGAALKVLEGTGRYLDQVLLIDVEVEFNQFYKGEALFGEVDNFLRGFGFELLDMNKYYANRKILGNQYTRRGQVMFADVLYVISIDAFFSRPMTDVQRTEKLWNLIVTLCLYGHFDVALEFVFHEQSTLSDNAKINIRKTIEEYTQIPQWKVLLFNNNLSEKLGVLIALVGNSIRIKYRMFGWGSDQSGIDIRYKYNFKTKIMRLFRK